MPPDVTHLSSLTDSYASIVPLSWCFLRPGSVLPACPSVSMSVCQSVSLSACLRACVSLFLDKRAPRQGGVKKHPAGPTRPHDPSLALTPFDLNLRELLRRVGIQRHQWKITAAAASRSAFRAPLRGTLSGTSVPRGSGIGSLPGGRGSGGAVGATFAHSKAPTSRSCPGGGDGVRR